jgi:HAE1 family hydrophobic/amphiphilic exporter-1
MMRGGLVSFTLGRRVTVLMMAAAVALMGIIAYFLVPLELAPRGFTESSATVMIPVTSSNPAEVQEQVIRPAEELIRTIPGITELSSRASANRASIQVQFSREVDQDLAVAELRDRLERARPSWPEDVRTYYIWRFNLDTDLPIISFAIDLLGGATGDVGYLVEETVVKRIEALPGVARVQCWGLLDDQVRVTVDRKKAESMGVSIYELTQTLANSNVELSAGDVEDGETRFSLRTDARFRDLDDIRNFSVSADGLRLSEIAQVEPVKAVRDRMALSRNRPSLWCRVTKESTANTVAVAARVRQLLEEEIRHDPRLKEMGASLRTYDDADMGLAITNALGTLRSTALSGGALALLVLLFFLRRLAPTLIITTSIPLSLLITLAYLYFSKGSLNIMSMLGITVSIGMLIDNSIVVVENIFRHREKGCSPLAAARAGASEVALAITLSTLTTLAAFLPIIFMSGQQELTFFTAAIGLPLCAAVLASLLVALVFIPLATVMFARGGVSLAAEGWRRSALLDWARASYGASLGRALAHRLLVIILVVAVVWALTLVAWRSLPQVDFMSEQGGSLSVSVKLDRNFSFSDAYEEMRHYGSWLEGRMGEYGIKHFWCFFDKRGGEFWINLDHKDIVKTKDVARVLKEAMPARPGGKLGFRVDDGSTEDRGKLSLDIHGPDSSRLLAISNELTEMLEGVPGVLSVTPDMEEGEEEIHIIPDREQTARYDIDPRGLRGTLEYGIRGWRFSDLIMEEKEIPLIIEYDGAADRDIPQLRELAIPTGTGSPVPLSSVADVRVTRGLGEIRRKNGRSSARLVIEGAEDDPSALTRRITERLATYSLPEGYAFTEARTADLAEAKREIMGAVILAVVFVFLLMGVLFESFVLPLSVLVAVPFSWAGAVWSLALTGTPIDFVGAIGLLVLVGIVVNNGIVLIDCAHRFIQEGMPRSQALLEAGRARFRPILMTAATTVVGLVPMALSDGGGSHISYKCLSRALIGGLCVSTFFTLFFVPILYTLFDDLRLGAGRFVGTVWPSRRAKATVGTPLPARHDA